MRLALLPIALALVAWSPSPPQGVSPLFSQAFQFEADCAGHDVVYDWRISSGTPQPSWHISPWLPSDSTIRGIELQAMTPPNHTALWWMVGNDTAEGDPMLFMDGQQQHAERFYPAGTGWEWPSASNAGPMDYIDLHGYCQAGHITMMMVLYYTVP